MKIRKLQLLLVFLFGLTLKSMGAPDPPKPNAIPPPVGAPVPLDSGISLLMASGVLLGIYFLLKKRNATPDLRVAERDPN
jgi:hypothetical protein